MKITYKGNFSFQLTTKNGIILINPKIEDLNNNKLIFTIFSDENNPIQFAGKPAINCPGEYEFEGIGVKSIHTRDSGMAQMIRIEDMNIGFLGDLKKIIAQEKFEPLLNTDILFLPKTGDGMSDKDLKKLFEEIDPRILILSGDEDLFPGLWKELNADKIQEMNEFEIATNKLPIDQTSFIKLLQS